MKKKALELLRANPRAAILMAGTLLLAAGVAAWSVPAALVCVGAVLIFDAYWEKGE